MDHKNINFKELCQYYFGYFLSMNNTFSFVIEREKSIQVFRSLIERLKKANNDVKVIADNSRVRFVSRISTNTSIIEITLSDSFFSDYRYGLSEPSITFTIALNLLEFYAKKSSDHLVFSFDPRHSSVTVAVGCGKFKETCTFGLNSHSYNDFRIVIDSVENVRVVRSFDAEVFVGLKKFFRKSTHIYIFAEKNGVRLSSTKEKQSLDQRVFQLTAKSSVGNDDSVNIRLNPCDLLLSINMAVLFSPEIKFYFKEEQPALIVRASGRHSDMKVLIEAALFESDSYDTVPATDDVSHRTGLTDTPLASPIARSTPPVQVGRVPLKLIEDPELRKRSQSILLSLDQGSQEVFRRREFSVYAENSQPQSSDSD